MSTKSPIKVFSVKSEENAKESHDSKTDKSGSGLLILLAVVSLSVSIYNNNFRHGETYQGVVVNNTGSRNGREVDIEILNGPYKGHFVIAVRC